MFLSGEDECSLAFVEMMLKKAGVGGQPVGMTCSPAEKGKVRSCGGSFHNVK